MNEKTAQIRKELTNMQKKLHIYFFTQWGWIKVGERKKNHGNEPFDKRLKLILNANRVANRSSKSVPFDVVAFYLTLSAHSNLMRTVSHFYRFERIPFFVRLQKLSMVSF